MELLSLCFLISLVTYKMSVMWSLLPLNKDGVVRYCHTVQEDNVTTRFTSLYSFQVTIGVFGHEEKVIYEPLTPAAIQVIFRILNKGLFNPIKILLTS